MNENKLNTGTGSDFSDFDMVRSAYRRRVEIAEQADRLMEADPDSPLPEDVLAELDRLNLATRKAMEHRLAQLEAWGVPSPSPEQLSQGWLNRQKNGPALQALYHRALTDCLSRQSRMTVIGCPALSGVDLVGGDFILADSLTGAFLLLDITGREKRDLPLLRRQGLITAPVTAMEMREHGLRSALPLVERTLSRRLPAVLQSLSSSPLNLLELRLPLGNCGELNKRLSALLKQGTDQEIGRCIEDLSGSVQDIETFCLDLEDRAKCECGDSRQRQSLLEYVQYIRNPGTNDGPGIDGTTCGALAFMRRMLQQLEQRRAAGAVVPPAVRAVDTDMRVTGKLSRLRVNRKKPPQAAR